MLMKKMQESVGDFINYKGFATKLQSLIGSMLSKGLVAKLSSWNNGKWLDFVL